MTVPASDNHQDNNVNRAIDVLISVIDSRGANLELKIEAIASLANYVPNEKAVRALASIIHPVLERAYDSDADVGQRAQRVVVAAIKALAHRH